MSTPGLHLDKLEVMRMPGFPPSRQFRIEDLSPGINIVHGPNESGKTTVGQAICMAVHGVPDREGRAILQASVGGDTGTFSVKVEGGHCTWLQEGETVQDGPVPPGGTADRYKLWLHELLRAEDPNRDFARQILEESAAGYRLRDARDALGFRPSSSGSNITERKECRQAEDRLREVRARAVDPRAVREELRLLRKEKALTEAQRERAYALERAEAFRRYATEVEAAEGRLQELPPTLETITGREPEWLEDLREQLALAEEKEQKAEVAIGRAQQARTQTNLPPDHEPPGELVPELRARVQKFQRCEDQLERLERELADAGAQAQEARAVLGEVTDLDLLGEIDAELVQRAERLCEQGEALRRKRTVLEAVEAWLGGEEATSDRDRVQDALRALERWLRESSEATPDAEPARLAGLFASLLVVLAGVVALLLGLTGTAGMAMGLLGGLLLVAGGVLLYLFLKRKRQDSPTTARPAYRRDFERTSLDPPTHWDEDSVEARLEELRRALGAIDLARERAEKRAELAPGREELAREADQHEADASGLAQELGIDPRAGDASFFWFVKNLAAWQSASREMVGTSSALEEARGQRESLSGAITSRLEPYGSPEPDSAEEALAFVEALDERFVAHRSAQQEERAARERLAEARDRAEKLRGEIADLWEEVGLDADDDAALQKLCDRLDDYNEASTAASEARVLRDQALTQLRKEPGYNAPMEEMGATEIQAELAALAGWSERLEELSKEIPTLEERIRTAKQADQVEAAIEVRDRALASLRDRMEREVRQVVGWSVAEAVHEETRDQDRPEVFKRAGRILTTITRGRYQLRFRDGDPPEFRAADTLDGETKKLSQLSSGTRVQLLLAVRLAFVEHQEQGARWPIILDETLATSDDVRARAILDAVLEIARDGRQVFYLTAQADEVAKWRSVLETGDPSVPPHRFIDLTQVRSLTEPVEAPGFEPVPVSRQTVPRPEGHDHSTYGKAIGVGPFDLGEPVEKLHVWYLVEDTDLLHTLLELGCESWGQLKGMREGTRTLHGLIPDPVWAKIQVLAEAATSCHAACRIGRGRKVDRIVLADAPGVSEKKIDEVASVADRVGGSGAELLAALAAGEVSYFQDSQREKLEEFLVQEGYLDERPPLSREDVERRTLAGVATDLQTSVLDRSAVLRLLDRLLTRA